MKRKRHVKIVIPCANEGEWLRVTVDSILESTAYPSYEIAVSANGDRSTDFSFLRKPPYRDKVRLREAREFLGTGGARNAAVRRGDAEVYVFLDAHCLLEDPDWLRRGVACLEEHPRASMVQPEVLEFVHEEEIRPGEAVDPSRLQGHQWVYSARWNWPYQEPADFSFLETSRLDARPYEAMAGAGMATLTRAETFHLLGGFESEVKGWHHETLDYCIRAWMLGRPMLVDPSFRVLHRIRTEKAKHPRSPLHRFQAALRTAYKYLSPRRRDLAELLCRRHGPGAEVDQALELLKGGNWLAERVRHLRGRGHDDDWLFGRFGVYEERFAG